MKRLLFMIVAVVVMTASDAWSQAAAPYLQGQQLRLVPNTESFGGVLVAPNGLGADEVYYLPAAGGTLLTSATVGWLLGGQGLVADDAMGSTTPHNVTLIANSVPRLQLLSGAAAVLLPAQTELRLGDGTGQYSALVSPPAITPDGAVAGNITYVLPSQLPGGVDVRLRVADLTGNQVTLAYTDPNTTGSIGFRKAGAPTDTDGQLGNDYLDIEGLYFTVNDDAIYSFEMVLQVESATNAADVLVQFGVPFGAGFKGVPIYVANLEVKYFIMNLTNNNPVNTGGEVHNVDAILTEGETYILKGYIETGVGGLVTPDDTTLQLIMRANQAGLVTVTAKSSVQLITE